VYQQQYTASQYGTIMTSLNSESANLQFKKIIAKRVKHTGEHINKTEEKIYKQQQLTKRYLKQYDTAKAKKAAKKKAVQKKVRAQQVATT
jgi:hypothetical protein